MYRATKTFRILSAVTATGASSAIEVSRYRTFTFFIEVTSVTSGCTVKIEALSPTGTWVPIDERVIKANTSDVYTTGGMFDQIRANVTARTDGTISVSVCAGD